MAIDKDLILKLRNVSQAGFADCKKALEENNNDLEASIKWLRSRGVSKANNKNAFKEAKEGTTLVKKDSCAVAIIELNSETDFTANSKEFGELSRGIIDVILEKKISNLEDAKKTTMKNGETVENNCLHLSSIVGEKIDFSRMVYFPISDEDSVSCYRHNNGKISTFIVFDKKVDDSAISGFSVHYAANNPKFLTEDEVDSNWKDSEREIIASVVAEEGKPEQFREKIIEERLKKVIFQNTFVGQSYLYEPKKTVGQKLDELGIKVKKAVCFELGESSNI